MMCPMMSVLMNVHGRDKTLGIVGYGDIGRATAGIGRAFRMKVVALRRRVQLSDDERKEGLQVMILASQSFAADDIPETCYF